MPELWQVAPHTIFKRKRKLRLHINNHGRSLCRGFALINLSGICGNVIPDKLKCRKCRRKIKNE